ncbi:hypothetical protein GTY54_16805 [Streptomyces sp. SID625]|nr:hypothetical protein [Streptomyces sp. SID625]
MVRGTSRGRTSKSLSVFQSGPAAVHQSVGQDPGRPVAALGRGRTHDDHPGHDLHAGTPLLAPRSSDQQSYRFVVLRACVHAGATISAVVARLLRGCSGPVPLASASCVFQRDTGAVPERKPTGRKGRKGRKEGIVG